MIRLFENSSQWISANLVYEGKEYIYEILLAPFPTRHGIYAGKIVKLNLYDEQDQKIAEYDQAWISGPEKGTDAYKVISKILKEHNYRKKGTITA